MSEPGSWRDPRGFWAAVAFAVLAALLNGIWILIDNGTPAWDQAHYLDVAWNYHQNLSQLGVVEFARAVHSLDPSRGPLFSFMLFPFFYVFDDPTKSGLVLNLLLAIVLYVSAGEIAMAIFRSWVARLLAILLAATLPLLVGLYHDTLQDFALATFATLSVLLLIRSELFRRRGTMLALGAALGLGTLTKVTFPVFLAGPVLVVLAQIGLAAWRDRGEGEPEARFELGRAGVNAALAGVVYLVLILPWYATNLSPTVEYVESTTGGPLALGAGPSDPIRFDPLYDFTMGVLNYDVSWIVVLAGAAALLLGARKAIAWFRPPLNADRIAAAALLGSWVAIPYLSLALGHNQDTRLMAPALAGIAVIVAGALAAVDRPRVRVALIAVTAVALVYQTVNRVTPIRPDFFPRDISVQLGAEEAVIPLDSRQMSYEVSPEDDYGTPLFEYLETVARDGAAEGPVPPKSVCLLQSDSIANGNTLNYLAHLRGAPLAFDDIFAGPGEQRELYEELRGCEIALYVKQPPHSGFESDRVGLVNLEYATRFMSPAMFDLFREPAAFPTDDSDDETQLVHVLVRREESEPAPASSGG